MTARYWRTVLAGSLAAACAVWAIGNLQGLPAAASGQQCDVAPRSYLDLTALLASPRATPPATTGGETLDAGTPASPAEGQAMRALIEEWLACQNEGKVFSAWALFSDAYLYRLISRQPPITEPLYIDWATPQPTDFDTAELLEISGERRLADGRLGAIVRISYASVPMPKQFFFYFVEQDETLLIDSILGEISFSVP